VWLRVGAVAGGGLAETEPSVIGLEKHALKADAPMVQPHQASTDRSVMHHSHQADTPDPKSSLLTVPMHDSSNDCTGHQAPCCTACVSFCGTSTFPSSPVILPRIERCLQFSDSLTVVVLARDIRPPII